MSKPNTSSVSPLAIGLLVVIILTAGILWMTNRFTHPAQPSVAASAAAQADDVKALVAKVAKHIIVKQDETPSVATVQDPDLLKKQSPIFYKDAQKGDRLLVWSDKVVLYSPSLDVILGVVMVNLPQLMANQQPATTPAAPPATPTPTPATATETATIEVRNGSGHSGMGKSEADKLTAGGLTVLAPGNAAAKVPSTIIVKAAGKDLPETLKKLQSLTGAAVADLPSGEAPLKGDFLVIVGQDFTP